MAKMTFEGDEKKINRLRKELKYRLKKDNIVLKTEGNIEEEVEETDNDIVESTKEANPVIKETEEAKILKERQSQLSEKFPDYDKLNINTSERSFNKLLKRNNNFLNK